VLGRLLAEGRVEGGQGLWVTVSGGLTPCTAWRRSVMLSLRRRSGHVRPRRLHRGVDSWWDVCRIKLCGLMSCKLYGLVGPTALRRRSPSWQDNPEVLWFPCGFVMSAMFGAPRGKPKMTEDLCMRLGGCGSCQRHLTMFDNLFFPAESPQLSLYHSLVFISTSLLHKKLVLTRIRIIKSLRIDAIQAQSQALLSFLSTTSYCSTLTL